jgi:hypothetical protein
VISISWRREREDEPDHRAEPGRRKRGAIGWLLPVSDRARRGAGAVERGGLEIRRRPCFLVPSYVGMGFVSAS